ncbi:hypothetical protein E3N88_32299 [Mikania micrantha]|uniref:Uncharacterized protein n=1 Tax=Mikania micrantha TaxID=192012 RepID=A0A5N6M845_9ASTR|nr:hypothetical protein E3N88_32299 [Mikania micrantha]
MVNVGENRTRNGVLDSPESQNEKITKYQNQGCLTARLAPASHARKYTRKQGVTSVPDACRNSDRNSKLEQLESGVCPIYKHSDLDITCGVNEVKVLPKEVKNRYKLRLQDLHTRLSR